MHSIVTFPESLLNWITYWTSFAIYRFEMLKLFQNVVQFEAHDAKELNECILSRGKWTLCGIVCCAYFIRLQFRIRIQLVFFFGKSFRDLSGEQYWLLQSVTFFVSIVIIYVFKFIWRQQIAAFFSAFFFKSIEMSERQSEREGKNDKQQT